jgi:hypothetical protein
MHQLSSVASNASIAIWLKVVVDEKQGLCSSIIGYINIICASVDCDPKWPLDTLFVIQIIIGLRKCPIRI